MASFAQAMAWAVPQGFVRPSGTEKALGKLIYFLKHIPHVEKLLHAAAHGILEIFLDRVLDDEYHLAEAGLPRVIQGIVNHTVSLIVDWGDLLQSAETGTHSGSHNDQYRFSHCILLLL